MVKPLTKLTHDLIKDLNLCDTDKNIAALSMQLAFLAGQQEILNSLSRKAAR